MEEEIRAFKEKFDKEGMFLYEYIEHKKYLRNKIDDIADDLLSINRILWSENEITEEQYVTMKIKIENSRRYYKRLVACC